MGMDWRKAGKGQNAGGKPGRAQKKEQKLQEKLRRKKLKLRAKRWERVSRGLDCCLVVTCFLAFLAAAVRELLAEKKDGTG